MKKMTGAKRNMEKSNDWDPAKERESLKKFLLEELKGLYWIEKYQLRLVSKFELYATTPELAEEFSDHLQATERQLSRIEDIFKVLGEKKQAKKDDTLEVLARVVEKSVDETEDETLVRDTALIFGAQKIGHYEIAIYSSMVQLANKVGEGEVAGILEETLREERESEQALSEIAEQFINNGIPIEEEELEDAEEE
jgi:ferritin-like metal-binding protein YciE